MKIAVLGLGYIGLPLACLAVEKGHSVVSFDVSERVLKAIRGGKSPFLDAEMDKKVSQLKDKLHPTNTAHDLASADVLVICVPTPVDDQMRPDLTAVRSATTTIASQLRKGQLVVLESTVSPLTLEEVMVPILDATELKLGVDYYLAHCPERINPGDTKWHVGNIPRVVGGMTPECGKRAHAFYTSIIDAPITLLSNAAAAEATKIIENTFRDINIAFVNELAKSFDKLGIDVVEVIKGASTKPFAFLPHWPGCGVGGHCISVDPYYLIETARSYGFDHEFLTLARKINKSMPAYTVERLADGLNEVGKSIKGTKVTLLGVAYKANVGDMRESPAFDVLDILKAKGALVTVFDPYVAQYSTVSSLADALRGAEAVVLATGHAVFQEIDPKTLHAAGVRVVVDGKNVFDPNACSAAGVVYRGIGRGNKRGAKHTTNHH